MLYGKVFAKCDNFVHVTFRRISLCWPKSTQSGVSGIMKILKWPIPFVTVLSMLVIQPTIGYAASCADKASAVTAQNGGELLSVATVGSGASAKCKITILIRSNDGGPARKKTIIVPK